ncbi:MAG: YfhO family protein [bacterium]|nr:YfhO family protein [bacterium]
MKSRKEEGRQVKPAVERIPVWVGAVLVSVVVVLFLWPVLVGKWFIWFDFVNQHIPRNAYLAQSLARGYLPQWDVTSYGGAPFLADPENAVFFPFNWLLVLGVSRGALDLLALQRLVVVEAMVAALCMLMALREVGAKTEGAVFGALAWVLSAAFVCRFMNYAHFTVIMCIPGVLWGLRYWEGRRTVWGITVAGLALGVAFLGGNPQYMYFLVLMVVLHMVCVIAEGVWKGGRMRGLAGVVGGHIGIMVVGLGVGAVNLVPIGEFFRMSQRGVEDIARGTGTPVKYMICYILPQFFGRVTGMRQEYWGHGGFWNYWEYSMYVGLLPLMLGGWGAVRLWRERGWLFLVMLILFAWAYAFGENNPLPAWLPFGKSMRIPGKFLIFAALGLCTLAGLMFDQVLKLVEERGGRGMWWGAFGAGVVLMVWDAWANTRGFNESEQDPRRVYPRIPALEALREEMRREHVRMDGRPFTAGNLRAMYYGLENMDGFAALVAQNVTEVRGVRGVNEERFNELWNVKYVFSRERGFVARQKYLPRAYVVRKMRRVERRALVRELSAESFDPWEEVLITTGETRVVGSGVRGKGDRVEIKAYAPERIEVEAELGEEGVLVMSENALPGWEVTTNGAPAKWIEVNGCFRGVELPAGLHRVVWEYETPGLRVGGVISGVSLGVVGLLGLSCWRRERSR